MAPSPTAFSNLTADDVAPSSSVDFSKPTVATVTLSDGNVITLTGAAVGDKHWIQIAGRQGCGLEHESQRPRIRDCQLSLRRRYSGPWSNCWCPSRSAVPNPPGRETRCAGREIRSAGHVNSLQREENGCRAQVVISGTSAGFGRRLAALVYDAFLLAALLVVFTGAALFFTHGAAVVPATAGTGSMCIA